MHFFAVRY